MGEKKFNRRVLREKCLQALYAYEMNKENLEQIFEMVLSDIVNEKGKDFVKNFLLARSWIIKLNPELITGK